MTRSATTTATDIAAVPAVSLPVVSDDPGTRPRFFSEADCQNISRWVTGAARGGGRASVEIWSTWTGNIRWARNRVQSSGTTRNDVIRVTRTVNGATGSTLANDTSARGLVAAVRCAERFASVQPEMPVDETIDRRTPETPLAPALFSEATYQQDDVARAELANQLARSAVDAGLLSAGYIEVSARAIGVFDSAGHARYFRYTDAQYSVTVRDPKGTGSGWAGDSGWDWSTIDGPKLSSIALEKCVKSQNPVRVEPGRYETILEPQAVCDIVGTVVFPQATNFPWYGALERSSFEGGAGIQGPFQKELGRAMFGKKVIDERLTLSTDPTDPAIGYPPFNPLHPVAPYTAPFLHDVYYPTAWIKDGVLVNLAYDHDYAIQKLHRPTGLPNSGGFRLSATGPVTPIEEMIAGTKRGLLVSRLSGVMVMDKGSMLCTGLTRDGLWLIEDGKISKSVKNFRFTESPLFVLNNVEQIGMPQRVFHSVNYPYIPIPASPQPVVVPALKVREFSFTALSDAV